ncbi:hypothetical protein [Aurantimonas coralicida]|uniref:hypothetical protein n=1 Tax=Aurantimonas coralicida TaxID=182270 RepID=UPI001E2FD54B|nr:hypothetical protein [Aurantimonas coralicida]MCD1645694.1 hypothetical protein [Aurantimonas coralicida]|tara:strand:- start:1037 stop:1333 length:297 start_codon:yes stop_codon:yes gene_type:complete
MNTANLQLEGLYAAFAAMMTAIRERGLLDAGEIDRALAVAEEKIVNDPGRPTKLSAANVEAICFPLRYLRLANEASARGEDLSFTQLAQNVGRMKPDR